MQAQLLINNNDHHEVNNTWTMDDDNYWINNFDLAFLAFLRSRIRTADVNLVVRSAICYSHAKPKKVRYELKFIVSLMQK